MYLWHVILSRDLCFSLFAEVKKEKDTYINIKIVYQ